MFLRQLDLTTALRPSLHDDETLLSVQDGVGLYEGKFKISHYQNGHAYLTSHRVCYVDNDDPRKYSVAVDLKEIERPEFSARFLKSSPKITLFPKATRRGVPALRSPVPRYASPADALITPGAPTSRPAASPAPPSTRDLNATWVCNVCGMSNAVPRNFDPATANQHTPLPPCQTCGVKPELALILKASISAMSNRPTSQTPAAFAKNGAAGSSPLFPKAINQCPRCTFQNDPSLRECEICGASLTAASIIALQDLNHGRTRPESPGPTLTGSILDDDTIETIKFSFRAGGEKPFLDRLKGALVQRKWLLQSAPPIPRPGLNSAPTGPGPGMSTNGQSMPATPPPRVVGIAGLERRGAELRQNNQTVIGTAFEDIEALMTSAKEVIAMAEQFAKQNGNDSVEARNLLSDSASALGLVTTKDMLGAGSASETLYVTELARNLAEFLTDDRRGVLRREGGIMSLVDLWAVFNRTRNGIELISPLDFEKAADMWENLRLPIRLRTFKSGLRVVQECSRTDERTISSLLAWLRDAQNSSGLPLEQTFGIGVTAQQTAERFGWSVGVATEELEMAEEIGALCRDQSLDGIRFWENHIMSTFGEQKTTDAAAMLSGIRI
ncbi:Vacuolar protein-sorting-associated protein 36 [Recurvomyces mirabilis]|uniref:Vacuolar protein-sorting-associated protein 36 n=1 Tax=Recurvomyces mirabilis TaxID=574656 RepID=A0AAE0WHV2_9PEZI|nr:Vacuolar protein-sorting-associated protein 36 [Recurvomyces mirabilis]KAK5150787.1 Vacuolar protein-sorting-associated protein 36 [Recurvomyces mirabilis]